MFLVNPKQFPQKHTRAHRVSEFSKPKAHEFLVLDRQLLSLGYLSICAKVWKGELEDWGLWE